MPSAGEEPVSSGPPPASPGRMEAVRILPLPSSAAEGLGPAELLAREEGSLRRVIQRYVRDAATVDDVFQEVSLKVLRRMDSVRDPLALRGWLFQLARNACLDHLRREDRRHQEPVDDLGERSATGELGRSPGDQVLSRERVEAVRRALDRLPESQRAVIRLRVEEGLDHLAIASRLGISRQAVEVRLCRGRATLKAQLDGIIGGEL
jgi:RNA polymerase sigma-70 factor (ECF subfamily)